MSSPIEHVVVLMMENRAFDHLLGFLPRIGALAAMKSLTGDEYNLRDPADLKAGAPIGCSIQSSTASSPRPSRKSPTAPCASSIARGSKPG